MHAASVERVPAAALGVLAEAIEIGLAVVLVDEIVLALARNEHRSLASPITFSASSNCPGFERWVISPVWIMKAGLAGRSLTFAIASFKVPSASGLAGLLNPTWLSGNLQEAEARGHFFGRLRRTRAEELRGFRHAPLSVQMTPVPAQIIHSRAPRRSIPLLVSSLTLSSLQKSQTEWNCKA